VLGCFYKSHTHRIQLKTEYIIIRDSERLGEAMRDKTCVAIKIVSARKEHYEAIVTEKSKLTSRDHPYPIRTT
jgi:ribosomal protein L7Ae-like RNA K-turn-binding protein